nr:response regulator [Acetatifactor sp.]
MKKLLGMIRDEERTAQERLLILIATVALIAMFSIFVVGIFIGESKEDLITLGGGFLIFLLCTYLAVKYKKTNVVAPIVGVLIIFILLPLTFLSSGGIDGGSPLWFVFCTLFISMIIEGKIKYILLVLDTMVAGACYFVAYYYPQYVIGHDRGVAYLDSYVSLVFVCAMLSLMVGFEIFVLKKEMQRSQAKSEEIESLNRAQNHFFSSMSHEIRTPINTIIGLNEMILRENASDEINEDATNIQAASKMLLHLINDILDMSKFESGQMELTPVPYHTGDMLSDVVGMLWIRAKEKNLEFRVDISPDLPEELYGDEVRIKQILINVLNNAIKYTAKGSVKLQIQCERKGNGRANVIYSVSDTGMGIKKESIPYLFTAFKRVDEDKNRYIEGTGLGLSIVKQFVELMGGKITVNSIYTQGSTFIIEIPQMIVSDKHIGELDVEKRHRYNQREAYAVSFEAPEAKVLVVDDTAANLLVVSKLLRTTKVQLTTATSGREALEKTLQDTYHVIFMDHMMPEMDGIECLHKIRTQTGGFCRESKIIALTANAGSET